MVLQLSAAVSGSYNQREALAGAPHSLRDDLAGHLRVNRAEVWISSRFAEGKGELLIRIEHFGFERALRADDRMWDIIAIGPRHGCPHWHGERSRAEAEVIDLHLRCFRFLLRACQKVTLAHGHRSHSEYQRRRQNCNRHTFPHAFSPLQLYLRSDWFLDLG